MISENIYFSRQHKQRRCWYTEKIKIYELRVWAQAIPSLCWWLNLYLSDDRIEYKERAVVHRVIISPGIYTNPLYTVNTKSRTITKIIRTSVWKQNMAKISCCYMTIRVHRSSTKNDLYFISTLYSKKRKTKPANLKAIKCIREISAHLLMENFINLTLLFGYIVENWQMMAAINPHFEKLDVAPLKLICDGAKTDDVKGKRCIFECYLKTWSKNSSQNFLCIIFLLTMIPKNPPSKRPLNHSLKLSFWHNPTKTVSWCVLIQSLEKQEPHTPVVAEVTRYSSEEMNSGNESNETHLWTEQERQADFNRHKEELLKRKRRRKKRTSSSIQSSCFQGKHYLGVLNSFMLL